MDAILVSGCPQCGKSHLYALVVARSHWQGLYYVPARPLQFTRLFTCPETEEDFQVTMTLMQPHGEDYERITVEGFIDAEDLGEIPSHKEYYEEKGLMCKFRESGIAESDLDIPPGGIDIKGIRVLGVFRSK